MARRWKVYMTCFPGELIKLPPAATLHPLCIRSCVSILISEGEWGVMQFNLEIDEVEQAAHQLDHWRRDTSSALVLEVRLKHPEPLDSLMSTGTAEIV